MKPRLCIWITALLCALTTLPARADGPSLDIAIDGPWIVYNKPVTFLNQKGESAPVIVLIAPGAAAPPFGHHIPTFNEGDSYLISPGIYCLSFGSYCAPLRNGASFTDNGHPAGQLLKVSVPNGWSWYSSKVDPYATYIILPMPDSYSNDGYWFMRFGQSFSTDGTGYKPQNPSPSIGIQLHYNNGPTNLTLFSCPDPKIQPDYEACDKQKQPRGTLPNGGTVHISMKNDSEVDTCDPHIRFAYEMMIKLLDTTDYPSPGTNNVNKTILFIDPAQNSHNGKPDYDDDPKGIPCRDSNHDPQKPKAGGSTGARNKTQSEHLVHGAAGLLLPMQIVEQVQEISNSLQTNPKKDDLLAREIGEEATELKEAYPTVSELQEVSKVFRDAAAKAEKLGFTKLAAEEKRIAVSADLKDGKDCKAPMMLVQ